MLPAGKGGLLRSDAAVLPVASRCGRQKKAKPSDEGFA
tara:strand:- start:431 stop:544 length:114 start_codon:yes stop_codon:yes gene_type:complete